MSFSDSATVCALNSAYRYATLWPGIIHAVSGYRQLCGVDFELYEASVRLAWVTETRPDARVLRGLHQGPGGPHTIRSWQPIIIPGHLGGETPAASIRGFAILSA